MRKSPLSPIPSPHHQRGAGRRGGPSFLLSPSELASQHVVALSPEEARKRLANLALFSSVEHLPESQEVELQTPRGLSKSEMRLLRETHEVTKASTPQKDFEAFLQQRLESGEFIRKMTEDEFKLRYKIGSYLGDGASSTVQTAINQTSGEEVAIKTVAAKLLLSHRSLFRECAILQKIKHPNIVEMKEAILTEANLYIVMEYVPGLSLFDHILQVRTYQERDARDTIKVLLGAVSYLHDSGIAHRDLKPENIIVSDQGENLLKIVDFGGSGIVPPDSDEEEGFSTPTESTPGYRAPEYFFSTYGRAVDVWSDINMDYLSCTPYWVMINKDTPELRSELLEGKVEFPSPFFDSISEAAKSFVRSLLTVQDEKRLTAKQSLEHEWMTCDLALAQSDEHILFDRLHSSPGLLESSDLPVVTRNRMQELKKALEQRLQTRPRIADLKHAGIYQSRESIF